MTEHTGTHAKADFDMPPDQIGAHPVLTPTTLNNNKPKKRERA